MRNWYSMVSAFLFLAICPVTADAQKKANTERKQLFDDNWKFALGEFPQGKESNYDDRSWRSLDLPHDWSIEGRIDPENPTGNDGGYFPAGIGWYRKTFTTPAAWQGKQVTIYFEGVYENSEVFVNGKSLGIRPYGYVSFHYDLTPHLVYNGSNTIAVRVDNSRQKNCRWYSGSGIYRHVWLLVTEPIHVAHWGLTITTPEVSREEAKIEVKTLVKNRTTSPQRIVVSTILADKNKSSSGKEETTVELKPNDDTEVIQTIRVKAPMLWSPETPDLYTAQITMLKEGKPVDRASSLFGIRSITFDTDNGFRLNGNKVILNGGCVHHDNGCLGAAAYDRAEERKVELLKAAGFNAVRTSHNPPSEAFLDACDRLGLLVIDESFDGWREKKTTFDYAMHFDKWWQRDIEAMVLRDRNHPSIIIWSIGNEIIEREKPEAIVTANNLAKHIRQLDPTRPVTSAMTTWGQGWERFDSLFAAHDIAGYNYQLHQASSDHKRVPSRIIMQTESYPRDAFANWRLVNDHEYIIGDFVWTAMDYLGESGIGRYYYPGEPDGQHWEKNFFPWHGAYCGDIDLTGWRKPISHYRDLLYNDDKKLYMAVKEPNPEKGEIKETMWSVWPTWESWTWPGYEGKDVQVEVYSRYPMVRLYLNDKLIDERSVTEAQEYKAVFTVRYAPGVLRAAGVVDGKEMESVTLKSAGKASRIRLVADRQEISADGQDLSYIMVEIVDEKGNPQPQATNQLQFSITGPGTIAGLDNANLKDPDLYTGSARRAWNGRALAVLRSTRKAGNIRLTVSSPGLPDATIVVKASSSK